jgi:phage-related protein
MGDVGTLLMRVKANTTDFHSKMGKVGSVLKGVGKTALVGAAGVVALTGGMAAVAKKSAEATDRIDKMSQKLGISRNGFQELDFVASQSGTSIDSLSMGMKTLAVKAVEASEGTGIGAEAFEKLGVSVLDSNGKLKNQETLLKESISAMQGMEDGTAKAALASDLLGRSGQELMPLLNGTTGSMEEMTQKAHDLGLVMSGESIDAGVQFTDTMDQLKRSFSVVGTEVGTALMPIFQDLAEIVIENMPAIKEATSKAFKIITEVVKAFWNFTNDYLIPIFGEVFDYIQKNWPTIKTTFVTVFDAIKVALESVWKFTDEYLIPIFQGVFNFIKDNWPAMKEIFTAAFESIWTVIESVWSLLEITLFPILKGVFDFISDNSETIGRIFSTAFGIIGDAISAVFDTFTSLITNIEKAYNWLVKFKNKENEGSISTVEGVTSDVRKNSFMMGTTYSGERANGGDVNAGESYLVGERGVETFTPSQNGSISAAGGNVTININGSTDTNMIMSKVVQVLRQNNIINR